MPDGVVATAPSTAKTGTPKIGTRAAPPGLPTSGAAAVQSVDRAVTVLEILARRGEARVTELAAELGVHKSTAFRLVVALEARGLVEQVVDRGRYRLGFGIVLLAGAASSGLDLTRQSRPVCERLAAQRFTPVTVTDPEALREQLAAARERGYAVAVEELEVGLNAVAAPLRSYDGAVVGAVSASGPSYRFPAERLPEVAALVVAGAADTSARLGHLRRTGSPTARAPCRV